MRRSSSARRRLRWLPALTCGFALTAIVLPPLATACPPCSELCGRVIAHGTSPSGEPWRIKVSHLPAGRTQPPSAVFRFSNGPCATVGYINVISLSTLTHFAFSALDGDGPEANISGVSGIGVRLLVARFADNSRVVIRPQMAPRTLRKRWPWLRRVGVFNKFLPSRSPLRELAACDARLRPLASVGGRNERPLYALLGVAVGKRARTLCRQGVIE